MKRPLLPSILAGLLGSAALLSGQASYHSVGFVYSEDFNSLNGQFTNLDTGSPHPWTNGVTVPNFYASLNDYWSTNRPVYGSRMYALRADGSAVDKALGSVPGGAQPAIYFGLRLVNTTGVTLTSFDLGYVGEQWRDSGNLIASQITVAWRVGSGSLTDGTWVSLPDATFTAPVTSGNVTDLNGNSAANRREIEASVSTDFSWAPNQELWIRWAHLDHPGTNHGLGIDDVTFAAIPEPAHAGLLVLAVSALALAWRRRRSGR
jgi:serralysin